MIGDIVSVSASLIPYNFCPSNPQDYVNVLSEILGATIDRTGENVEMTFGFFLPGFCPEGESGPQEFVDELSKIIRGYVPSTGERVKFTFSVPSDFCWTDPQALAYSLANAATGIVIE